MSKTINYNMKTRRGISLLEVVVSLLITSVLITAATRTLTAAKRRETDTLDRMSEYYLANELLNEILLQAFSDPDQVQSFGPETGEVNGTRLLFDDVDDYHGLNETPPKARNGASLTQFNSITRQVQVSWVASTSPHAPATSGSGLKKITVTVLRGPKIIVSLVAYRSSGFQNRAKL